MRSFLGAQGMKKGDISKFIEEAVRWRIFHQTVGEAREAFADVSPDELQKMIDKAVEDVRSKHYRELSAGVRKSEAVTLRNPVMPVTDGFSG